jgi:hypothetical protein
MELFTFLLLQIAILGILIILIRWLGAWMLRITDVLKNQREIIEELKKLNAKK